MQQPTLSDVHIRTVQDAHKLFFAVQLGLLPKIDRRLDAHERNALKPGNVYVWEEKAPPNIAASPLDATPTPYAVTMERFTEGKSWTASRVRDDFLMYYESTKKKKGERDEAPQRARSLENQIIREGERDLYIKLTYSVFRTDDSDIAGPSTSKDSKDKKKPKKWHLNAYFTKFTEGQLRTIDDIPFLKDLVVPEGLYKTARTTAKSSVAGTKRPHTSLLVSPDYSHGGAPGGGLTIKAGGAGGGGVQRTYAPFPSSHPRSLRSAPVHAKAEDERKVAFLQPPTTPSAAANWHPPMMPPPPLTRTSDEAQNQQHQTQTSVPSLSTALPPSLLPTSSSLFSALASSPPSSSPTTGVYVHPPGPVTHAGLMALHQQAHTPALSDTSSHSSSPGSVYEPMDFVDDLPQPLPRHPHQPHPVYPSYPGGGGYGRQQEDDETLRMLISLEDPDEDLSSYVPAPPLVAVGMMIPTAASSASSLFGLQGTSSSLPSFAPLHHQQQQPRSSPRMHYQSSSSSSSGGWSGDEAASSPMQCPPSAGEASGRRGRSVSVGVEGAGTGCERVALVPLHSLQRNHPYRRSEVDDSALRALAMGPLPAK